MTNPQYQSGDTSNDVLFRLDAIHPQPPLNYLIIAQSELEVQDVQNAPAISMSTFISETEQTQLLTRISIYSQRGERSEEIRLLYMNEVAYSTWKAMGKDPHVIGSQHRPPTTASLTFGVPFSDKGNSLGFERCSRGKIKRNSVGTIWAGFDCTRVVHWSAPSHLFT